MAGANRFGWALGATPLPCRVDSVDVALLAQRRRLPVARLEVVPGEPERRLSRLKGRRAHFDARLRYLASSHARKHDTRRKILAGVILLARVEAGEFDFRTFRRSLDKALTRKDDRELFESPAK
jgi:hypothetical protein